jgi:2-amino-4-hydroxy-6-hydroxymethyldihydropteridine diphosphokinase
VTKLDTSGKQVRITYLGIGSNLGNKKDNIEKAKFLLIENNINIISVSSYYNTPSWPNPKNPEFINIVIKAKSVLEPEILLDLCKSIESKLGRKKTKKNSPRECDIDIIDFDGKIRRKGLILPHKMMHLRNFVLVPLFEIEKNWCHPIMKTNIKKLIFSLPNKDIRSIKKI